MSGPGREQGLADWVLTGLIDLAQGLKYVATQGRAPLHEASYKNGQWLNWNAHVLARPRVYLTPRTEDEICEAVRGQRRLRGVGAGHSFNACPCSDEAMLSLDGYDNIIAVDSEARTVQVQAGIRLRALNELLAQRGLALPCVGSTDAQGLAGVLSTDVHGTGRDHGFLSEQVLALRIVDAEGRAETHPIESEVCQAALGGLGLLGVITEVVLQCEPAYNLRKEIRILDPHELDGALPQLMAENDHLSLYYLGGTRDTPVRVNLWRRTTDPPTPENKEFRGRIELLELLYAGFLMGNAAHLGLIEHNGRVGQQLFRKLTEGVAHVYPWQQGFPRKLYYRHDEIEYGVPLSRWRPCLQEVQELLQRRGRAALIEVRFTPDRSRALLGPGVGRQTCYIELAASLAQDTAEIFAEAEAILRRHEGQPHLGKSHTLSAAAMAEIFGERYRRFVALSRARDPGGKFMNPYCARLFGEP